MKKSKKGGKKFKNVETTGPEVPSDIVPNILSRLPTKSCLRYKLVCKEWYQLIKTHEFAKLRSSRGKYHYLTILPNTRRRRFLMLEMDNSPSKVDDKTGDLILSNDVMISTETVVKCSELHKYGVVNECNGLGLLATSKSWSHGLPIVICNLVTGEHVNIDHHEDEGHPLYAVDFGLGCCPASEQFKILRILNNRVAKVQILGSNEWRTVENAPAFYPCDMIGNRAFLHGSLHRYFRRDNIIWCFDFETERFWQISTPDGFKGGYWWSTVSVFSSCLCLTTFSYLGPKKVLEIWVMKEYGVKDSWVKQFDIQIRGAVSRGVVPLFETGSGEILFYDSGLVNLRKYDIHSKIWKKVKILGISSVKIRLMHHANSISFSKFQ